MRGSVGIDGGKRKTPAGVFGLGADGLERLGRPDWIAAVEPVLDPGQSPLFRARDRLLKSVSPAEKQPGRSGMTTP
jgi:hypothetical protein